MDPALNNLLAATVCFVGGHFILSSEPLRSRLMRLLGEWVFRAAYSVIVFAALIWMAVAYRAAPVMPVWTPPEAFVWIPLLVMPGALVLAVSGMTTPNPTMIAGERLVDEATGPTARGIVTITRHPFLWGTTLWALSHLSIRGDLASIVLLGGILFLSLGGMVHIDRRREAVLGRSKGWLPQP